MQTTTCFGVHSGRGPCRRAGHMREDPSYLEPGSLPVTVFHLRGGPVRNAAGVWSPELARGDKLGPMALCLTTIWHPTASASPAILAPDETKLRAPT